MFELARNLVPAEVCARVEPGFGVHRRHMRFGGTRVSREVPTGKDRELFRIPRLDHAEAPELAFGAVEVAVMVGVASDEPVAADAVVCLHSLDHMDRERQPCDPRFSITLIP